MAHKKLIACAVAAALAVATNAHAADSRTGPFGFAPIAESANSNDWDPTAPWMIPEGFTQSVVSDETDLNIYDGGRDDWNDMNTVNETGRHAGRYLYRTHELRLPASLPEGGTVSVVDLKRGEAKILAQDPSYDALDGIRWTPWGTVLFAEEVDDGRLFEIVLDKNNPMSGTVYDRPALGRLAHEGIDIGPDGAVYVVDEQRGLTDSTGCDSTPCGGGVYRFVPDRRGDLSSGKLYVLKVLDNADLEGVGQAEWAGPIDPLTARASGSAIGGTSYQRPEDLEIIGDTLYVAITEGTRNALGAENYDGRVLAVNLNSLMVTDFVKPGVNAPVEIGRPGDEGFQTGFDNPDNLAQSPDGKLVIVEDNVPSDIWFAGKDLDKDGAADATWLFGSLSDPDAEGTGIYFGQDPQTLFVNVQHSAAADGDATWAITKTK
ncbi:MAG: alkaline phosphatase PhoX [Bdellovibrio bacteriovorus]